MLIPKVPFDSADSCIMKSRPCPRWSFSGPHYKLDSDDITTKAMWIQYLHFWLKTEAVFMNI